MIRSLLISLFFMIVASPGFAFDDSVYKSILPGRSESRWLSIPWRINLARARIESQATGKPIFLWIMDGHVLGST